MKIRRRVAAVISQDRRHYLPLPKWKGSRSGAAATGPCIADAGPTNPNAVKADSDARVAARIAAGG